MESLTTIILIVTIIVNILVIGSIVITIFKPNYRLWPPLAKLHGNFGRYGFYQ